MVVTGTKYGYRRDDGVFVIPIGCLKDLEQLLRADALSGYEIHLINRLMPEEVAFTTKMKYSTRAALFRKVPTGA